MSVVHRHDGYEVTLMAVTEKSDNDPDSLFWKYTPHGKMTFRYPLIEEPSYVPGNLYWLDVSRSSNAINEKNWNHNWATFPCLWVMSEIRITGKEARTFKLIRSASQWNKGPVPWSGKFEFQVDNGAGFSVLGIEVETWWSIEIYSVQGQ